MQMRRLADLAFLFGEWLGGGGIVRARPAGLEIAGGACYGEGEIND